ncbi:MAG: YopX family protein [Sphingobacterium sp.]
MNKREILFRAWHRERKEMYWFDLMWGQTGRSGSGWIGMLPIGEEIKYNAFRPDNRILLDPDGCDIMQFTGLKDKNGKEIYEGDIIEGDMDVYLYGKHCDVYFFHGSFCVSLSYDCTMIQLHECEKVYNPSLYPKDRDKTDWLNEFTVIGNIHDNPELMKGEK